MNAVETTQRPSQLLGRQLLINFVVYNPMFLFSAMLILGGAMLLNPPSPGGGRDLGLLLQLFSAIQVYEFCLLGAAAILVRRGDLKRDVRNLSLVLSPFLVDVTFTTATLIGGVSQQVGLAAACSLAGGVLLLALLKLRLVSPLTGKRFDGPVWLGLLAGPALVTLYPFLVGTLSFRNVRGDWVWLLGGAAIGAIGILFAWLSQRTPAREENTSPTGSIPFSSWQLRCLAAVPLAVGCYHVLGTGYSWSLSAGDPSTYLLILGPIALAAGLALPWLVWPAYAARDQVSALIFPALGALFLGLAEGEALGISSWNLGLGGVAVVCGIQFFRHGSVRFVAGGLLALHMTLGGPHMADSLAGFGSNPMEPLVLLALFAYGVYRKVESQALGIPAIVAAILTARLGLFGNALDAIVGLDVVGLCLLAWTHRMHGCRAEGVSYRFVGASLLWLPPLLLGISNSAVAHHGLAAGGAAIVALLVAGVVLRQRTYVIPALLIPMGAAHRLAPSSAGGWGALGIALAFLAVCGGVVVSLQRQRILAWLEDGAEQPAQPHSTRELSRAA